MTSCIASLQTSGLLICGLIELLASSIHALARVWNAFEIVGAQHFITSVSIPAVLHDECIINRINHQNIMIQTSTTIILENTITV